MGKMVILNDKVHRLAQELAGDISKVAGRELSINTAIYLAVKQFKKDMEDKPERREELKEVFEKNPPKGKTKFDRFMDSIHID